LSTFGGSDPPDDDDAGPELAGRDDDAGEELAGRDEDAGEELAGRDDDAGAELLTVPVHAVPFRVKLVGTANVPLALKPMPVNEPPDGMEAFHAALDAIVMAWLGAAACVTLTGQPF